MESYQLNQMAAVHSVITRERGTGWEALQQETISCEEKKYKEFFNEYYLPVLLKYRWHQFHMMILGKRHTENDIQRIQCGELHSL